MYLLHIIISYFLVQAYTKSAGPANKENIIAAIPIKNISFPPILIISCFFRKRFHAHVNLITYN